MKKAIQLIKYISIFLAFPLISIGQAKSIDSLIESLKYNQIADSNKLKKLVKISGNLVVLNSGKSEFYIKQALELTKSVNNPYWKAWTYHTFAELEGRKGNFLTAIEFISKASFLFDSIHQPLFAARCEYGLATHHLNIGNYNEGLKHIIEAEKKFLLLNNLTEASNAMLVKSSIYLAQNKPNLQEKELRKCLEIKRTIQDSNGLVCVYSELSIPLIGKNHLDEAEKSVNEALKILAVQPNPFYLKACFGNLGQIFMSRKMYSKAIEFYSKSLDISTQFEDKKGICESSNKLAEVFLALLDAHKSLLYANNALLISKENHDLKEQKTSYEILSKGYELNMDYKNALMYHKKYKQIEDSLLNKASMNSINEVNIKYETEKKETVNIILESKNKLAAVTIKQQKMTGYFITAGLLLSLLLALFIFKGLRQQRNANKIITEQKNEVELQKNYVEQKNHIIEETQKEILDSIHYAKKIQYALLANSELLQKNLPEHFVLFKPKDIVSGDFYWATKYDNKFYLAVCDSTGHGVPGAFMSLLNIGFLSEAIKEKNIVNPSEILNYVRKRLIESIGNDGQQDGMDAILVCFDKTLNTITYSAANNEPILISNNEIIELAKDKMPVGKGEKTDSFTTHTIVANKGDMLYLYTDGYADQFGGPKGKKLKYKTLNELLLKNIAKPMNEQAEILNIEFENWRGNLEQVDDVCIVGIKL